MKRIALLSVLAAIILTSCESSQDKSAQVTAASSLAPTAIETATATAAPPSPTPTLTPTAAPVIGPQNAGQVRELVKLGRGTAQSVAISPDGATLAVAGSVGVWLYELNTLDLIGPLEGHTGDVYSVAWSPDGRTLASGSTDRTVRLWDPASGEQLVMLEGHASWVRSVAWPPDGRTLASAGGYDNTVRLWGLPHN
jgi:WD40 repeat protein